MSFQLADGPLVGARDMLGDVSFDCALLLQGMMRSIEMIAALQGDLNVQVPVSTSGGTGEARMITGRNGELRNDHPYVSAVVVIHENLFGQLRYHSDTFVTNSPGAEVLAPSFFSGEDDHVYEFSARTGTYTLR